jgi:hypothetical protein
LREEGEREERKTHLLRRRFTERTHNVLAELDGDELLLLRVVERYFVSRVRGREEKNRKKRTGNG